MVKGEEIVIGLGAVAGIVYILDKKLPALTGGSGPSIIQIPSLKETVKETVYNATTTTTNAVKDIATLPKEVLDYVKQQNYNTFAQTLPAETQYGIEHGFLYYDEQGNLKDRGLTGGFLAGIGENARLTWLAIRGGKLENNIWTLPTGEQFVGSTGLPLIKTPNEAANTSPPATPTPNNDFVGPLPELKTEVFSGLTNVNGKLVPTTQAATTSYAKSAVVKEIEPLKLTGGLSTSQLSALRTAAQNKGIPNATSLSGTVLQRLLK